MQCDHFDADRCRSCTLLAQPYVVQVDDKQARAQAVLGTTTNLAWLSPLTSAESGFRNKAKMVVTGTADQPALGILGPHGAGVDLRDCPLHLPSVQDALPVLARFIALARLTPYDVSRRAGELKYLLVTGSPDGELMVRFVLRSTESLARIRKHLPWLRAALPTARVVSVNLQPEHKAILEGEHEVVLTEADALPMRLNDVVLHLRPQSFFQTNTDVAAALYRQVSSWVDDLAPSSLWDLFCGVGGFALHCAAPRREVVGIEASAEAVASARLSAMALGAVGPRFEVGDATAFALGAVARRSIAEVVVVNPPRRGIGTELAECLDASAARAIVYSSCNVESLAKDLARMPSWLVSRAQVLDMFPQTTHDEVLVLLTRG